MKRLYLFYWDILYIQLQNVTVSEAQRKLWTTRYSLRRWISLLFATI